MFRRGEAVARYSNRLDAAGQWQAPPSLRAAIETERARTWTAEEAADFLRTHARLRNGLGAEWTQRLDEILSQAEPLMRHTQLSPGERRQALAGLQRESGQHPDRPSREAEADAEPEAGL